MDLAARRGEFVALEQRGDGPRLAYLDSAATTLTPRPVIEAVATAMGTLGNPGRGVHQMADAAREAVAAARETVASALVGWQRAPRPDDIVFTSGATASINLVADTWGREHVGAGDVVIATRAEHHSNLLPWQRLCARAAAQLQLVDVDDRGRLDLDALRALLRGHGERVKLVAVAHVSNVLGTIAPVAEIAREAHAVGAKVLVDGAQAIAHLDVEPAALGCDFYAFSGHKVYGPPGTGVLWADGLLGEMPPWQVGGGMVGSVTAERTTWADPPARFEAGTPNTPGIVGLARALAWARSTCVASRTETRSLRDDEALVLAALCDTIREAGARILGAPEVGVVSFVWDYHPHDIATIADGEGVALRSGFHCAQPIHARFGVEASTRASVACYSGLDDVEQLGRALAKVRAVLGPR